MCHIPRHRAGHISTHTSYHIPRVISSVGKINGLQVSLISLQFAPLSLYWFRRLRPGLHTNAQLNSFCSNATLIMESILASKVLK